MSRFEAADCWFSMPATTTTDVEGNTKTEEATIKHAFSVVRSQNLQPWAAYSAEIVIPVRLGQRSFTAAVQFCKFYRI